MKMWQRRMAVAALMTVTCGGWLAVASGQQKAATTQQATADALLGAAHYQEQIEGRLDAAIASYRKVLAAADATREQKARAQFRIGVCYERLGAGEALKAYEAVVANFPDQAGLATQAKARLVALGTEPTLAPRTAAARLIWSKANGTLPTPINDGGGVASPDGKYLVYTSFTSGDGYNLQIYDMASGTSRRLTPSTGCTAAACDMSMYSTVWSHDGVRIAYAWSSGDKYVLRIINADGTAQRLLRDGIMSVYDWSPDGQELLAMTSTRPGVLVAVRASDGSMRTLAGPDSPDNGRLHVSGVRYSPDGRYIALDRAKPTDVLDSDLYLMRADGSGQTAVLDDSSSTKLVGWTPDGSALVFVSDRGQSLGLWSLPVTDGKSTGAPRLVKANLGGWPSSLTRDGSVFYSVRGSTTDVYTVTLDPSMAMLTAPPSNVASVDVGGTTAPAWSRDGKVLGYLSSGTGMQSVAELQVLQTLYIETGKRRRVTLSEPASLFGVAYAITGRADALAFLTLVHGKDGASALGSIDMRTGDITRKIPRLQAAAYSNDRARAYSLTSDRATKTATLNVTDLETQVMREIYRGTELYSYPRISVSPDDNAVAYEERTGPNREASVLKVLQVESGEWREVYRAAEHVTIRAVAWSADGTRIFFSTYAGTGERDGQLWSIPAGGGPVVRYDTNIGLINNIAVHPDGRRLALHARRYEPDQMWVLERFLPPANGKAATAKK
ncbi:MAG: tetratricopeptide repeat protein [Acidobacteria bacterium]|nr:tetratricopeptide repeat protein [Acidobacteriota bacterium]